MTRRGLIAMCALGALQLVSAGCRGKEFVVYANHLNGKEQVVGFEAAPQPLRQWWHGDKKEPAADGQFVRDDGKGWSSGTYSSEGNAYLLSNSKDTAKIERFTVQPDLSLLDDNGVIWRRSDGAIREMKTLERWASK